MEVDSTPASAPATTASADTGTAAPATTSAPMTAHAALEAADSSPAQPDTAHATDSTPVAATSQPAVEAGVQEIASDQPKTGEPPKWRWQDILENARKTSSEEAAARVRAEVEQQYAWAKDLQAEEAANVAQWARALKSDPVAALRQLQSVLEQDTRYADALKPQTVPSDPMPEPDLQTQDGTPVYSGPQQRLKDEWMERTLTAKLTKGFAEQLKPFESVAKTFQQREAHAKAFSEVGQVLTEFRADPDFTAHEADVKAELANDPRLAALADRDPKAALEIAYSRVYRAKVLPSQQQQSEAKTLAHLQQRAVSGTLNPSTAAPTTPSPTIGNARAALLAAGE